MGFQDIYNYYMEEISDPFTRDWPLICSPFTIFITLAYLYFIYNIGPRYMKNRSPYELKNFILIYNIIQIVANIWLVKEHVSAGWTTKYTLICFIPDRTAPEAHKLFNIIWYVFILKLFDYIETCMFVLRKKQNQVSGLHVFHHVTNAVIIWCGLKYYLDERVTFITLINSLVHVIMYIYYLLAGWNTKVKNIILPIKPYITILQMVQFLIILVVMSQSLFSYCPSDGKENVAIFFTTYVVIVFILFYDFYVKTYKKTSKPKHN